MANKNSGEEIFRPYARLITILGDQLITNKIVAINEIVKNSYDADANKVTVRFFNFENFGRKNVPEEKKPTIEIEDDGDGMSIETIKNVWLRPATPNKFNQKKGALRFTKKGRLMQGEKGIGRFAIHKIGDTINIYTKSSGNKEAQLQLNFAEYDKGPQLNLFETQEQIDSNYKFLDEIKNKWYVHDQSKRIKKKGTLIQIRDVRDNWTENDLINLKKSFSNLIPPAIPKEDRGQLKLKFNIVTDFKIDIDWQGSLLNNDELITFATVCDQAPFKFVAEVDGAGKLSYKYSSDIRSSSSIEKTIDLLNNNLALSLYSINKRFFKEDSSRNKIQTHSPTCGPFKFILYGFDLYEKTKWKSRKDELEFIKDNGIYLFRDGIRVYPYGNKEIDWLEISKKRAEFKAGDFFSYNDLIGFIFISHDENSRLKDATNREGLMDIDGAYEDFKALMIASVQVMKFESDTDKGKREKKNHPPFAVLKKNFSDSFSLLSSKLEKIENKEIHEAAQKYFQSTATYVNEVNRRGEIYEDLAGLGLAVEKASHDSFSMIQKVLLNINDFKNRLIRNQEIPRKEMIQLLSDLEESSNHIYNQLQLIEPLFRVSKRSESTISITETIKKILRYFKLELDKYNIKVSFDIKNDIKLKTSTGLIFQIFINLMDNSIYWLIEKGDRNKEIDIKIDGIRNEIVFADNSVGIADDIRDLVFMEFYSTKPKERGRGLGLYIVKEIIDRMDGSIELITDDRRKLLKGANFKIILPKQPSK